MSATRDRGGEARHLTERQLATALLAGETPVCPVPGCSRCAPAIAELQRLDRQFHDEVLPRGLRRAPEGAAQAPARPSPGGWWRRLRGAATRPWAMGLVAAAALLLWVFGLRSPARDDGGDLGGRGGYLGEKGARDAARVYLRPAAGGEVRRIDDGAAVYPGDRLRFAVAPSRGRFALVVSIDGAQQISVYAPFGGGASEQVPTPTSTPTAESPRPAGALGELVELPGSVELDGTLGDERLWILLSDQPLEVREVRPALERLAAAGAAAVQAAAAAALTGARDDVHAITLRLRKAPAPTPP